jgi:hypothetical protein
VAWVVAKENRGEDVAKFCEAVDMLGMKLLRSLPTSVATALTSFNNMKYVREPPS